MSILSKICFSSTGLKGSRVKVIGVPSQRKTTVTLAFVRFALARDRCACKTGAAGNSTHKHCAASVYKYRRQEGTPIARPKAILVKFLG